jgi:hypothetical protein
MGFPMHCTIKGCCLDRVKIYIRSPRFIYEVTYPQMAESFELVMSIVKALMVTTDPHSLCQNT